MKTDDLTNGELIKLLRRHKGAVICSVMHATDCVQVRVYKQDLILQMSGHDDEPAPFYVRLSHIPHCTDLYLHAV